MAEKLVEVTVKKDGIVHDGKGGRCEKGDKIKVSKESAKALKDSELA